ncbi:hypothetical protein Tco_0726093 [Tanacetum coccineum]|uniref:Uncharacterized protein n=1 Tax=Tanacetum coccineum TaxID=301880 RepID=A0ABQ4YH58_9ASTR
MDTFVILIYSDSLEESVGTSTARGILFGMIPTTILATTPTVDLPVIHDDTSWIPTETPTISLIVPTIPPIAPTIQYTSPFICTDSSDSDTPDTPPSYPSYSSSSNHFTSDDSSRDSPSETSPDSHLDTSSDSSSRHSSLGYAISDSPCDLPTATSAGLSHRRHKSPTSSVHVASPVHRSLSLVRADLLPPCKRIRDSNSMTDFEVSSEDGYVLYVPREIRLGVDVEDSYEPYTEPDIDPDV